jgi:electron-transferring-flavoprotein dehydrogenase
MDILAKVTVLGEGVRGSLAKQLIQKFDLEGEQPQVFETGVKEIWRVKPEKHQPGRVIHGMVLEELKHSFGGMWLYDMKDNLISYGMVKALEAESPFHDPHLAAQKFKTHPFMRDLLDGAELIRYGAKTIPIGGLYAQPKLYVDGALLIGDAAGMCNAVKLAGIHLAIKTGMLAAETIVDAVAKDDYTSTTLGGHTERYKQSWAYQEHYKDRNFHGSWCKGLAFFMLNEPFRMYLTNGRGLVDKLSFEAGHEATSKLADLPGSHLRQGHPGPVQRGAARVRSAPAPGRVRHGSLSRRLHRGVWEPLRELLPGGGLRDDRRRGESGEEEALHPPRELRPLQDLRHRRSVPGHHVDATGRRRGSRLHADVTR